MESDATAEFQVRRCSWAHVQTIGYLWCLEWVAAGHQVGSCVRATQPQGFVSWRRLWRSRSRVWWLGEDIVCWPGDKARRKGLRSPLQGLKSHAAPALVSSGARGEALDPRSLTSSVCSQRLTRFSFRPQGVVQRLDELCVSIRRPAKQLSAAQMAILWEPRAVLADKSQYSLCSIYSSEQCLGGQFGSPVWVKPSTKSTSYRPVIPLLTHPKEGKNLIRRRLCLQRGLFITKESLEAIWVW